MMKRALILLTMVMLTLSACAPAAAPTSTRAAALLPTGTPAPTATPTHIPSPTATPTHTPSSTATPTPIPTLPPEQLGGLTGVPDPRYSNPELFDLNDPDAPIPQFVHAMRMAGIEVAPEQVAQGLGFEVVTGADGKEYVVGYTQNTGADLSDGVPLLIWREGEGWREAFPKDNPNILTFIELSNGDHISSIELPIAADFDGVFLAVAFDERYMGKYGNPDKWLDVAVQYNKEIITSPLFGKHVPEGVIPDESYARSRLGKIFDKLIEYGYGKERNFTVILVNEPLNNDEYGRRNPGSWGTGNPYYKTLGETNWILNAYKLMWEVALEKGLTPGKDFNVIAINGLLVGNTPGGAQAVNRAYIETAKNIRNQLSQELGVPAEEVPFDLGGIFYIGDPLAGMTRPFFEEEVSNFQIDSLLDDIRTELPGSKFWVLEFSVSPRDKTFVTAAEIISQAIPPLAVNNDIVRGLNLWRALGEGHLGLPDNSRFPNFIYGEQGRKEISYYALLKALFVSGSK